MPPNSATPNNFSFHFSYEALPLQVRSALKLEKDEVYDKDKMVLSVEMTNAYPIKRFNRIFCNHCEARYLPDLIKKYKSSFGVANLVDLIDCWDQAKVKWKLRYFQPYIKT